MMKNLGQMMKQAQEVQTKMQEMQDRLAEAELTGASGGGMVSITMTGKGEVRRVSIDPSLIVADDKEVLEDLIAAAVNDALLAAKAQARPSSPAPAGGAPSWRPG